MTKQSFANILAKDLMTQEPIAIEARATIREAWQILSQNRISGAPVINQQRHIVGVLSQQDLIRRLFEERSEHHEQSSYYHSLPVLSESFIPSGEDLHELFEVRVEEVMNPYVITVAPHDTLPAVAAIMRSHHIHRVIVAEKKNVVGVITTFDLLSLVENQ